MHSSRGSSLIEVIIAATVGILVITALTFATIFSLRNAHFAKNSAQATKLAQEGIEKVRSIRDRDNNVDIGSDVIKFSELFDLDLSHDSCGDGPCYFVFESGILKQKTAVNFETLGSFKRQILISDETIATCSATDYSKYCNQKTITVVVQWTDFAGPHESKLTTILRKL
ncbi:MAG: hypothetical protein Q7R77_02085 [Candidatus Daviesbacteria bacterium]|nr:hypothetical protein [Candidatus Daviesbacteria bacterium]